MAVSEEKKDLSLTQRLDAYAPFVWALISINDTLRPIPYGPLRAMLLSPSWLLRIGRDKTVGQDFALIILVGFYQNGFSGLRLPDWVVEHRVMELKIFSILCLLMMFAGLIVIRGEEPPLQAKNGEIEDPEEYPLPPLLLPGRTTHTRLFPKKHSFDYSYLSVGIPVGWKGRAGSLLSANLDLIEPEERQRGWFNVNASDYLYRGGSERGLEARLRHYLHGEGVSDDAWSFAYLVTAPKFLGYSFNPVSFWYIYDEDEHLTMMVLEVNNTFGERRIYLLKAEGSAETQAPPPAGYEVPGKGIKFSNAWVKDFHVSPFNSRKGTYSLTSSDLLANLKADAPVLDNLIVLNSSKAHAKLVARLFSEGPPQDPTTLTTLEVAKILGSWFWVGFMTLPRVLYQAFQLYFKRGLHVWFKPEILATSIGRDHTATESTIEVLFRGYLTSLVEQCSEPLRVNYIPPGSLGTPRTISSTTHKDGCAEMTLRVLTPAFYSRFAHYAHTREAFDREGLHASEKNQTIVITNPEHLSVLLSPTPPTSDLGLLDSLRWKLLFALRCPAPAAAYADPVDPSMHISDIRATPPSALDRYAISRADKTTILYRRALTRLFIAQRFFAGFEGVVDIFDWGVRIALVVAWLKVAAAGSGIEGAGRGWRNFGAGELVGRVGGWALVNGLHFWALAKGV